VTDLEPSIAPARAIAQAEAPGFIAFLDGIQRSRVVDHIDGVVPIVHATVATAIRVRSDRTLRAWRDGAKVEQAILLPAQLAEPALLAAFEAAGFPVIDTAPDTSDSHPLQLLSAARIAVQGRREALERELAEWWCASESGSLYVDGGIGGHGEASLKAQVVGVVKSHRTLYGGANVARQVAALGVGERSPAFTVATRRRSGVASWYLRLREGAADPLDGLVRVEVAAAAFSSARADEVSGWILCERSPVALPDSRWRVMAYGIRETEEYLRAVTA
jgi:hypothetical protein